MATTQELLTQITTDRNTIRNKMVNFGLAESSAKLTALATAIDGIALVGAPTVEVKEGETYTIAPGYYKGGTVAGVAGGGNYSLQSKEITPTKSQQAITSDEGYYGLSEVIVEAIPEAYQDVTSVTAAAGDVLSGKIIVESDGIVTAGTMANNGAVSATISVDSPSYTVPAGYHNGSGAIVIDPEEKSATPTEEAQFITPSAGKVLSKVTVNPIPSTYIQTLDATADASQILAGETAYVNTVKVEGTMANNGAVSKVLDATADNQSYVVPEGYHNGEGAVSIVLEEKSATPTKAEQTVVPSAGKVLSKVTVAAIPDEYQVVTGVTAAAGDVLAGKVIVDATGAEITGTMANNGDVSATIDGLTSTSVTIPAGYTTGGTVSLTDDIYNLLAAI